MPKGKLREITIKGKSYLIVPMNVMRTILKSSEYKFGTKLKKVM